MKLTMYWVQFEAGGKSLKIKEIECEKNEDGDYSWRTEICGVLKDKIVKHGERNILGETPQEAVEKFNRLLDERIGYLNNSKKMANDLLIELD